MHPGENGKIKILISNCVFLQIAFHRRISICMYVLRILNEVSSE